MINKITIIGVGLIGGSLAKRLKQEGFATEIIGFGRNDKNLQAAKNLGIIDLWTQDIELAIKYSDIIVLATPIGVFKDILKQIKPFVKNQIITDVGSTKQSVEKDVKDILGNDFKNFVPAHPIAGKEKSGCESADENLFKNKKLIITGGKKSNKKIIQEMWLLTGAVVSEMDSKTHDDIFGLTSHLPHLLAFGLVGQMAKQKGAEKFIGGGFKDFSRIASSDSTMWADIFENNKDEVLNHLENYQQELKSLAKLIKNNEKDKYKKYFAEAKKNRDTWI
jgi:prephenate dehydrogenase